MPNRQVLLDHSGEESSRKFVGAVAEIRKTDKRSSEQTMLMRQVINEHRDNAQSSHTFSKRDRDDLKPKNRSDILPAKKPTIRRSHTIGSLQDAIVNMHARSDVDRKKNTLRKELQHSSSYSPTMEGTFNFKRSSLTSTAESPDEVVDKLNTQRSPRPSVAGAQRPSKVNVFAVTKSLLRAKRALLPKKQIDKDKDNIAENLPKTPRFSSSLSVEAQYALLMGYEDKLADTLSKKCPEYIGMIKRNKTPHHSVALSDKSGIYMGKKRQTFKDEDQSQQETDAEDRENHFVGHEFQATQTLQNGISQTMRQNSGATTKQDEQNRKESVASSLENLRRLSLVLPPASGNRTEKYDVFADSDRAIHRRHTVYGVVPSMVPRDKQLALSYRLERAMDLVDSMRPVWENTLSPRVRQRKDAPVVDYNRWADQWSTEFKSNVVN